jgi:predicted dehydrogenase
MMQKRLRLGIAGANAQRGWAKDAHLAAITALAGLEIYAVSARNQELAELAATHFGASKAYASSLDLARDPDIDVIAVTVKVPEHRDIVLAALSAGKHIYCEWPLGRDVAETEELAEAARKAGVHTVIGTQGAYSTAVRHAAHLVQKGIVGEPLSLKVVSPTAGWGPSAPAFYGYLNDRANGATPASIAGGHALAAMEAVAGRLLEIQTLGQTRIREVKITGSDETLKRDCFDHIVAIGRHQSGCLSSLEVVAAAPDLPFSFELRGTKGTLTISGHHPGGYQVGNLVVTTNPPSEPQPAAAAPDLIGPPANVAEIWSRFANDIRLGTQSVPGFSDAVPLARLVALLESPAARV